MTMSPVPQLVRRKAERLLDKYISKRSGRLACPHVVLDYAWDGDGIVLTCRDGCKPPWPIARFRYTTELHQWFLFAPDQANGWHPCLEIRPALDLERHLQHLDEDPFRRFWPPAFPCCS